MSGMSGEVAEGDSSHDGLPGGDLPVVADDYVSPENRFRIRRDPGNVMGSSGDTMSILAGHNRETDEETSRNELPEVSRIKQPMEVCINLNIGTAVTD